VKSKLNQCAVCPSREDLEAQFDVTGRLYFLCRLHAWLDREIVKRFSATVARMTALAK